jgi:hypothetical protein
LLDADPELSQARLEQIIRLSSLTSKPEIADVAVSILGRLWDEKRDSEAV